MSKEKFSYFHGEQLFFSVLAENLQMSFRPFKRNWDYFKANIPTYPVNEENFDVALWDWKNFVKESGIDGVVRSFDSFSAAFQVAHDTLKKEQWGVKS